MATSTLGSGTLVLAGTTSGTTTVTATAVAGTTTLTLPAATDTLVGKATTDTLTNKTLTGAVIVGTTTNNNANAGSVGEVISSSVAVGSAVSLTDAVSGTSGTTITSISLTAGDWDVFGSAAVNTAATTNFTSIAGGISTVNNELNSVFEEETRFRYGAAGLVPGTVISFTFPTTRVSIASTTTYYLIGYASFTVSTATAFGRITARRMR